MQSSKWFFGKIHIWIGRSDYEHPSRWAGIYITKIGEIEFHITSDKIHDIDIPLIDKDECYYECPYSIEAHDEMVGHKFVSINP